MDALTVETRPAVIDSNFAAIRTQLEQHLAEYDEVVTVDTVKAAKSRATEINKLSGEIDSRRKAAVDEASAPINEFKAQAKELTTMCQNVRQRILDQVKAFESETLDTVRALLISHRDELYSKQGLREEFQCAHMEGWEKLSWLTASGNLTSTAKKEVEAAVSHYLNLQQRTDMRLSRLENESHRAGLHSYLTREHVEGILFAPDEQYIAGVEKLIARELERQEETERRAREKLEREQAEAAAAKEQEPEPEPEPGATEPEPEPMPAAAESPEPQDPAPASTTGQQTKLVRVDLCIEVEVPAVATAEYVAGKLLETLKNAGVHDSIRSHRAYDVAQEKAA